MINQENKLQEQTKIDQSAQFYNENIQKISVHRRKEAD